MHYCGTFCWKWSSEIHKWTSGRSVGEALGETYTCTNPIHFSRSLLLLGGSLLVRNEASLQMQTGKWFQRMASFLKMHTTTGWEVLRKKVSCGLGSVSHWRTLAGPYLIKCFRGLVHRYGWQLAMGFGISLRVVLHKHQNVGYIYIHSHVLCAFIHECTDSSMVYRLL